MNSLLMGKLLATSIAFVRNNQEDVLIEICTDKNTTIFTPVNLGTHVPKFVELDNLVVQVTRLVSWYYSSDKACGTIVISKERITLTDKYSSKSTMHFDLREGILTNNRGDILVRPFLMSKPRRVSLRQKMARSVQTESKVIENHNMIAHLLTGKDLINVQLSKECTLVVTDVDYRHQWTLIDTFSELLLSDIAYLTKVCKFTNLMLDFMDVHRTVLAATCRDTGVVVAKIKLSQEGRPESLKVTNPYPNVSSIFKKSGLAPITSYDVSKALAAGIYNKGNTEFMEVDI